jgi:hypothetical protein
MTANTTIDLLERYLQAIGDHLPAATRDDVLAELRANLQAQLDDRAEELNRPLTEPEVAAILKDHGRPVVVAARYLPQQYLIGPAIFPYYLMALRKATPIALIIYFLARCSSLFFVHTLTDLIGGIAHAVGLLIPDFISFVFWFTVAFAIVEYVYTQNHAKPFGISWNPAKLPAVRPPHQGRSRAARIADLIFHCLWMLYFLAIPSHPYLILGPNEIVLHIFPIAFAPIWHTLYILIIIVLVLQLITKILALTPAFDRWQSALDLLTKLFGVASTAFLATIKTYFVATSPSANQAMLANLNYWANFSFRIILAIAVIDLLVGAWKLFRPALRAKSFAF